MDRHVIRSNTECDSASDEKIMEPVLFILGLQFKPVMSYPLNNQEIIGISLSFISIY